jgi:hypothetical protein
MRHLPPVLNKRHCMIQNHFTSYQPEKDQSSQVVVHHNVSEHINVD